MWQVLGVVLSFSLLMAQGETVLRRVELSSAGKTYGEVRVLNRDGGVVVQTVLHSRYLRKIAGKIAKKEEKAWSPSEPFGVASARYVVALADIANQIRISGKSQGMLIEFILTEGAGMVRLVAADVQGSPDSFKVLATRQPEWSEPFPREYVEANQRFIVMDTFGVTAQAAESILAGKVH